MTLSHIDGVVEGARERDLAFQMDEDLFRAFYDRTSRGLASYLVRLCGDRQLAADLLQETYYRFLRSTATFDSDAHRRQYLFRIATNLIYDHRRRPAIERPASTDIESSATHVDSHVADRFAKRIDVTRAMARLKPRERSMLWLAYAQGWSHEEIAQAIGVKTASLKSMLSRARHRLVQALKEPGGPS